MIDKLVWMDYFRGFHWKNIFKNHKENKSFGGFLIFLNLFLIWPFGVFHLEDGEFLRYLTVIFPFMITFFTPDLVPLGLPKLMYMGPLGKEERREYLKKQLRIRVMFPNIILAVSLVIMLLLGHTKLQFVIPVMGESIMLSVALMFFGAKVSVGTNLGIPVWAVAQMIISLVMSIFNIYGYAINDYLIKYSVQFSVFVLVVVQLPIAIKILSHEKMVQENMLNYEVVINGEISW